MRDAASAAAMSDPELNRWFRRKWVDAVVMQPEVEPTTPPPEYELEIVGTELLAAWRSERARREQAR